jgi:hypothetical protein
MDFHPFFRKINSQIIPFCSSFPVITLEDYIKFVSIIVPNFIDFFLRDYSIYIFYTANDCKSVFERKNWLFSL